MILQWSISLALLGPTDSLNLKMLEHLNRPHDEAIRLRFTEHFKNDTNAAWQAERAISFYNVADYAKSAQILESLDSTQRAINRIEDYHVASGLAIGNINVLQHNKAYSNYLALFTKNKIDLSTYSDKVQLRYNKYQRVKRKSILLAGLLSTIPGLGKMYCGNNRQARSSVVVQSFFGIISVESIYRYGLQSAVGQSAISVSGLWWLSGIYGTMKSLKKEKSDRKTALIKAIWEEENRKLIRTKRAISKALSDYTLWQQDSLLNCRLHVILAANDSLRAEAEWRYFKQCVEESLNEQAEESLKRMDYSALSTETKKELYQILPLFWFNRDNYTEALKWKNGDLAEGSDKLELLYNEIHLRRKEYQFIGEKFQTCLSSTVEGSSDEIRRSKVLPIQYAYLNKPGKVVTTSLMYISPAMLLAGGIIGQMPISGALLSIYTGYRIYGSSAEASDSAAEKDELKKQQELFQKRIDCLKSK